MAHLIIDSNDPDRKEKLSILRLLQSGKSGMSKAMLSKLYLKLLSSTTQLSDRISLQEIAQQIETSGDITILDNVTIVRFDKDKARKVKDRGVAFRMGRKGRLRTLRDRIPRIDEFQHGTKEKENTISKSPVKLGHIDPMVLEIHDKNTGRLNAKNLATFLKIPLKTLANAVRSKYSTIHKSPDADSLQEKLFPIYKCIRILYQFYGKPEAILAWLNTPHPNLEKKTPLDLIVNGKTELVLSLLDNALEGIPG